MRQAAIDLQTAVYTAASKFYISALRDEHLRFGISANDTAVSAAALDVAEKVVRASGDISDKSVRCSCVIC